MSISTDNSIKLERRPSTASLNTATENVIHNYFEFLCSFNYEKAKSIIDKNKELKDNSKLGVLFQNALLQLINAEKIYNNIQFISQKSSNKDKYYEPIISNLENALKDANAAQTSQSHTRTSTCGSLQSSISSSSHSSPLDIFKFSELITQLIQFADFRTQMMNLYHDLKEKENQDKLVIMSQLLGVLNDIDEKYKLLFLHPFLQPIRNIYGLEMSLAKNLFECHLAIGGESFDCIQSIVNLKIIGDLFTQHLPQLNTKQSKEPKGFFFSRSTTNSQKQIPILYQWFRIYYQLLVNKFSIYMHDSFSQIIPSAKINEMEHIMNEKVDAYNKLLTFAKKTSVSLCAISVDTNSVGVNDSKHNFFAGNGYQLAESRPLKLQGFDSIPFIFCYQIKQDSISTHKHNIIGFLNADLESKVKYFYDPVLKSTYYLYKIQDNWTFCFIYELNKQENKAKTMAFVQEICEELNLIKIFNSFNVNLK